MYHLAIYKIFRLFACLKLEEQIIFFLFLFDFRPVKVCLIFWQKLIHVFA
jgi:hypothetical protein